MEIISENGNCANVVSMNIATEMIRDKEEMHNVMNETQMTDSKESLTFSKNLDDVTTQSDSDEDNSDSAKGATNHTVPTYSDASISNESGESFTDQIENSMNFVECQQPFQGLPPVSQFQPTMPYYYNSNQLYNPVPMYQCSQSGFNPYQTYESQNCMYYQMQQNQVPQPYSNMPQNNAQFCGVQYSTDTGSDGEKSENPSTEQSTIDNANETIQPESSENLDLPTAQEVPPNELYESHQYNASPNVYSYPPQYNPYYTVPNINTYQNSFMYHQGLFEMNNFQQNVTPQMTTCNFPQSQPQQFVDRQKFQYPAIYVSTTGLITVLMKNDVSVETTLDQTIRLVNHQQKLVASINSRGNSSFLFHPAAHILQDLTTTEVEIFLGRKVKMTTDYIKFANNFNCYTFDFYKIEKSTPDFEDLSKDRSVSFLFSDSMSPTQEVLQKCSDVASKAEFERNQRGGICVRVNGFKIVQTVKGDVIVTGKGKYLRMSPTTSVLRLDTNFITIDVEMNWNVRIKRGGHTVNASHLGFVVSNGKIEAAFDEENKIHACKLPHRRPLIIGEDNSETY